MGKLSAKVAVESKLSRHEAFIRLHHLHQGNDEKEKPLLRLLKELGLDAVVYYGKPAMIHIQGDPKDVDSFAGTAKRRHRCGCKEGLVGQRHPRGASAKARPWRDIVF